MLSYEIAGSILTIRAIGAPTAEHRDAVFAAVQADGRVPNGALLLIDASELTVPLNKEAATERLRRWFEGLRPKVGRVCAVIVEIDRVVDSRFFQIAGTNLDLLVGVFTDEPSARRWLTAYENHQIAG